jgi:hypothetical protein
LCGVDLNAQLLLEFGNGYPLVFNGFIQVGCKGCCLLFKSFCFVFDADLFDFKGLVADFSLFNGFDAGMVCTGYL